MRSSDWSSDVCSSDLIAWLDRAFRRLQANGEALDGARDLIERNPAPFEEGRCRRFFGGLFSIRVIPGDGTIGRACRGRCRADAFDGVRQETPPSAPRAAHAASVNRSRSEEHTSELQSLMRISYAVFCLKKK